LHLYYRQALRRERRQRAERIADINAALIGGKHGAALLNRLESDDQ